MMFCCPSAAVVFFVVARVADVVFLFRCVSNEQNKIIRFNDYVISGSVTNLTMSGFNEQCIGC